MSVRIVTNNNAEAEFWNIDDIVLTGVVSTSCNLSALAFQNVSACNDNGTPADPADDFFTADVVVTFANAPAAGTLDLTGDANASVAVGALDGPTSHTFTGLQFPANGANLSLTAAFSDDAACTFTNNALPGVASCSNQACNVSAISLSGVSSCNDNGTPADPADDFVTADVTITFLNAPATGDLALSGAANASINVASLASATSHTFFNVALPSDGAVFSLTAEFSADPACTFTDNTFGPFAPCVAPEVGFAGPASVSYEAFGTGYVAVTMFGAPASDVTVDITDTGAGTATGGGVDYTFSTVQLLFPQAGTYPLTQTFTYLVTDDGAGDPGETIEFALSITSGVALPGLATHTATIQELGSTLIVNEVSQGPSGLFEYIELLVVGEPGATADLRGYILDDNNGDFSGGLGTSLGISNGFVAFENNCEWERVPVGSLIVLYNGFERNVALPADDPTDANQDYVYVIGIGASSGVSCNPITPNVYFGGNTSDPNNTSGAYPLPAGPDACWATIGLSNTGDAAQVRLPNSDFFHGLSYGAKGTTSTCSGCQYNAANHPQFATYGNEALYFSEAGANRIYFLENTVSDDFFLKSNWATATATGNETPGAPNSAANAAYINALRQPLPPATTASTRICVLRGEEGRAFINSQDEIILFVRNDTTLNHGTATATVSFGVTGDQNTALADQPFFLSPDWTLDVTDETLNPKYAVTFYVTDAQLDDFAAFINTQNGTAFSGASIAPLVQVYKGAGAVSPKNGAPLNVQVAPTLIGSAGPYTTYTASFTSFSTFALGAPAATLPVELLSLEAQAAGRMVQVSWTTAREENSARFEIQRSADGIAFEKVGERAAAGFSDAPRAYAFTDVSPVSGINYYRLRTVDFDGSFSFSPVVEAFLGQGAAFTLVRLHPNPTENLVYAEVALAADRKLSLRVLTLSGQVLAASEIEGAAGHQTLPIDLQALPQGIYLLEFTCEGQRAYQRVVRQ